MKIISLILAFLFCISVAEADNKFTPSVYQPFGKSAGQIYTTMSYKSMDEAAKGVFGPVFELCPRTAECGGVIYLGKDDKYYVTLPITAWFPYGLPILDQIYFQPLPENMVKIVADYHSHVCDKHNRPFSAYFSHADAVSNSNLHTVGYMFSFCDNNIRKFDPSQDDIDDEEVDFSSGNKVYLTTGHVIGWVDVNEQR